MVELQTLVEPKFVDGDVKFEALDVWNVVYVVGLEAGRRDNHKQAWQGGCAKISGVIPA